ncbi:cell filamentation protein Fic [bacterium F11]|nr:cell filamentation protein Fic [bacterium F11]
MYIHQRKNWPQFQWDESKLSSLLAQTRLSQGRLLGRMGTLGFQLKNEATLSMLTQDVIKTSAIEGENLSPASVRSSVARRLGIEIDNESKPDRNVEGIVDIMLDASRKYDKPIGQKRLFDWHGALFPTGYSGMKKIMVGQWRNDSKGPMQIVSGPMNHEKVHFEAPPAKKIKHEMNQYISWFNSSTNSDLVIKASLAHYWFVVIHPFEDGNGRIARALSDMVLARSENSSHRFYSMSSQIDKERKSYYSILEHCSNGDLDITAWHEWFLNCLIKAIGASDALLDSVLAKAKFWEEHAGEIFNQRQVEMVNRLFDNFIGKLTSSKWAKITKCSPDTALRDINDLVDRQILKKEQSGGRSTHYSLKR